jgi:hypothetical protein
LANEIPGARAAINGTYFNTRTNDPVGEPWGGGMTYLKVNGSVIHTFDGTDVITAGMGMMYNNRTDVAFQKRTTPWANVSPSWQNLMVCGPPLVMDGVIESYAPTNDHANLRHPRTAVGINGAGTRLYLVTVDGRTSEAAGMSCTELANVMVALGCRHALNLDGGGSTTLWAAGEPFNGVVNYPSDNGSYDHLGERSAANALVIVADPPTPKPWDGRFGSITFDALTRSGETFPVTVTVANVGTETWTRETVTVVPARPLGRTSAFVPAGNESGFAVMTPATVAPGQTATFTLNLVAPTVQSNTLMEENFALRQVSLGYFGPPDNKMRVRTTVRPKLTGAPGILIIQGTPTGPNNQWYSETSAGWANSSVMFSSNIAGVSNSGTQRYVGASVTGRSARFTPIFDVPGIYRVDAAFPHSTNNINSVRYTIHHRNGQSSVTLNQNSTALAAQWNVLGEFEFTAESNNNTGVHYVVVDNPTVTGNRFYSGAIRFDYVGPLPGTPTPTPSPTPVEQAYWLLE